MLTFETCANTCTRMYGCAGIAHNQQNNTCYLSHLPINNRPMPAVYSGEHDTNNLICNKIFSICSHLLAIKHVKG